MLNPSGQIVGKVCRLELAYLCRANCACSNPTLHPDDHRPRRPGARPHLRLGHHRLRRRAVGPTLDHRRHLPRGPCLGPRPHHGRPLPVLSPLRQPRGAVEAGGGRSAGPHRSPRPTATSGRASCTSACRTSPSGPSPTTRRSTSSGRPPKRIWNPSEKELNRVLGVSWEEWEIPRDADETWPD